MLNSTPSKDAPLNGKYQAAHDMFLMSPPKLQKITRSNI